MFRFVIMNRRGKVEDGIVTMDENTDIDMAMADAFQAEIDFRRKVEEQYFPGIDALAIEALTRWNAEISERTKTPNDPSTIY